MSVATKELPPAELVDRIRVMLTQANDGSQGIHTQLFLFSSAMEMSAPHDCLRKSTVASIKLFILQVESGSTRLPAPVREMFLTSMKDIIHGQ